MSSAVRPSELMRPRKRPISPYMLFRAGFVKRFRDPDETLKVVYARAKQGWDSLSLSDQNIWQERFVDLKARYDSDEQVKLRAADKLEKEQKKRKRAQSADVLEVEAKLMREETIPFRVCQKPNI